MKEAKEEKTKEAPKESKADKKAKKQGFSPEVIETIRREILGGL